MKLKTILQLYAATSLLVSSQVIGGFLPTAYAIGTSQPATLTASGEDRNAKTFTATWNYVGTYPAGQTRNYVTDLSDENGMLSVGIECNTQGDCITETYGQAFLPLDHAMHVMMVTVTWDASDTTYTWTMDGDAFATEVVTGFVPSFTGDQDLSHSPLFPAEGTQPAPAAVNDSWISMSVGGMFASLSETATAFFGHSQWEGFWLVIFVAAAIMVGLYAVEWLIAKIKGARRRP